MKKVLLEALLVAAAGAAFAFAANALSPRRLELTRNYFPQDQFARTNFTPAGTSPSGTTNFSSPLELLAENIRQQGLHLADTKQVAQLYRDPRYSKNLIVFVDARGEEHYKEGHIPGAYQLDHFYFQKYLATVLPACQIAEQVVVYCNGGNCDDSLGTASVLLSANIAAEKILVYGGGMSEWTTNGMPVELGERKSGQMRVENK